MATWNKSFGRAAQVVVGVALLATVGSIVFIYDYNQRTNTVTPQWVDPFDRPDLTAHQQDFYRAVDRGDVRTVRSMLSGTPSLAKLSIESIGAPLHIAATRDMVDMTRALLDAGADINAVGTWGGTPLHWAAYLGRIDTVRLLIERGATLEPRCTMYDATPLLWASYGSGSAERWQYNRYRGRRTQGFNRGDNFDWQAERERRRRQRDYDYADCVAALIEAGADMNTRNRDGVPAIAFGIPVVTQTLIFFGAKNDSVPPAPPPEDVEGGPVSPTESVESIVPATPI